MRGLPALTMLAASGTSEGQTKPTMAEHIVDRTKFRVMPRIRRGGTVIPPRAVP
jgi:hypothetical protein